MRMNSFFKLASLVGGRSRRVIQQRLVSSLWRKKSQQGPPWKMMFNKAMLEHDPAIIFSTVDENKSKAEESRNEWRLNALETLELEAPQKMRDEYKGMSSYGRHLASLVVEETISSIGEGTAKLLGGSRAPKGITVRILERDRRFAACFTHSELSKKDRDNLRAGSVVVFVSKGAGVKPKKSTMGIVRLGSRRSRDGELGIYLLYSNHLL